MHITSGPLYVAMWPLFSSEPYARYCAAFICLLNALRCAYAICLGDCITPAPVTTCYIDMHQTR